MIPPETINAIHKQLHPLALEAARYLRNEESLTINYEFGSVTFKTSNNNENNN